MNLETMSTDKLFDRYHSALACGDFVTARACADEMCRPVRKGTCPDLAAMPRHAPAFAGYSDAQLATITDRIAQYNSYRV